MQFLSSLVLFDSIQFRYPGQAQVDTGDSTTRPQNEEWKSDTSWVMGYLPLYFYFKIIVRDVLKLFTLS